MKTRVKIKQATKPEKVTFADLELGTWYDSNSMHGICIKIASCTAVSVTNGTMLSADRNWPNCTVISAVVVTYK